MNIAYDFLVLLHLIGMACLVGGFLAHAKNPTIVPAMWHGALTQLVTGFALAGLASAKIGHDGEVNHAKIGIKCVVALVVAICLMVGRKGNETRNRQMAIVGGALAFVNVVIAVFV